MKAVINVNCNHIYSGIALLWTNANSCWKKWVVQKRRSYLIKAVNRSLHFTCIPISISSIKLFFPTPSTLIIRAGVSWIRNRASSHIPIRSIDSQVVIYLDENCLASVVESGSLEALRSIVQVNTEINQHLVGCQPTGWHHPNVLTRPSADQSP